MSKMICIDSSGCKKLIEGKTYKLVDVYTCLCGGTSFNVGVYDDSLADCSLMECRCGIITRKNKLGTYYRSSRFIEAEADEAMNEEINQALKENLKINN